MSPRKWTREIQFKRIAVAFQGIAVSFFSFFPNRSNRGKKEEKGEKKGKSEKGRKTKEKDIDKRVF